MESTSVTFCTMHSNGFCLRDHIVMTWHVFRGAKGSNFEDHFLYYYLFFSKNILHLFTKLSKHSSPKKQVSAP